ncbi:hypothetical protein N8810_02040 [Flavobacteriaceae bacterium]|nr:hypothetical protein [Flavobacteriaceae bacterium]
MSSYIEKIEQDYNDGKISKEEATKLKLDYQKNWGGDDIEELENELKGINPKKKSTKQSTSKKSSQFNFINYKNERNAFWLKFYPTSRTLYKIFEVINIIALIILVILLIFVFTSDFGVVGIPIVIATAFSVISFFLFKEMLLFQVDKNFLLYKQSEKYLK